MTAYTVKGRGKFVAHKRRHLCLRGRVDGTPARLCLAATHSSHHTVTQMIDDITGHTLTSASDIRAALAKEVGTKTEKAHKVGALITGCAKAAGITAVVSDRGGNKYFDRVAAIAEAACEGGLEL